MIRIALIILLSFASLEASSNDLPTPRIVILGQTGVGKSTLANVLLGQPFDCKNCTFPVCDNMDSCTKNTKYATGSWLGQGMNFTVVDTPGFGDSDQDDDVLIDEMMTTLKNAVKSANTLMLLVKGDQTRFNSALQQMLREMEALFGRMFWNNVIIGVSFWPYDKASVANREHHGITEAKFIREWNKQLAEKFRINPSVQGVFIDAMSQDQWNKNDPAQQEAFQRETGKLWTFSKTSELFAFKTVEDILKENVKLKNEVDWLNDIITKNITELQEKVNKQNRDINQHTKDITQHTHEISQHTQEITSNKNSINNATKNLSSKVNSLDSKTDRLSQTINATRNELSCDIMTLRTNITINTQDIIDNKKHISNVTKTFDKATDDLSTKVNLLDSKTDKLSKAINDTSNELSIDIMTLKTDVTSNTQDIMENKKYISNVSKTCEKATDDLASKVDLFDSKMDSLSKTINDTSNALNSDIIKNSAAIMALKTDVGSNTQGILENRNSILNVTKTCDKATDNLLSKVNMLDSKTDALSKTINDTSNAMNSDIVKNSADIMTLKTNANKNKLDIIDNKNSISNVTKTFDKAKDDLSSKVDLLNSKTDTLNKTIVDTSNAFGSKINKNSADIQEIKTGVSFNFGLISKNEQSISTLEDNVKNLRLAPLGAIIPWVSRPSHSNTHVETLPSGWVRCDGKEIPAPSVWAGQMTPNINGEERFLRGASDDSDMLKMEDDSIQTHTHGINDPGHTHGYDDDYIEDHNGSSFGSQFPSKCTQREETTNKGMTGITVSYPEGAGVRVDEETRPKNMRVVYIMKVY